MANTEPDEDDYSHLPKDWMDKQVGQSVYNSVTLLLERISILCVYRAPAKIDGTFDDENMKLSVVWPFLLPTATGELGDWPATERDIERFEHEFIAYLAEGHLGWEFATLLYRELCKFLLKKAKAY